MLTTGLVLLTSASAALLATAVGGWTSPALVAALLMAVALAFGMTMPNIMNATMQPLPDIAGAVGATAGSIQMAAGAASSGLVAALFDGRSALSMTAVMAACSLLALITYRLLASPERNIVGRSSSPSPAEAVAKGDCQHETLENRYFQR